MRESRGRGGRGKREKQGGDSAERSRSFKSLSPLFCSVLEEK